MSGGWIISHSVVFLTDGEKGKIFQRVGLQSVLFVHLGATITNLMFNTNNSMNEHRA